MTAVLPATLAAVDLDRTLIYSAAAAGDTAGLEVVEHLDGAPLSHATPASWALLAELAGRALVVPVTTRTVAQYERVRLPLLPRYALCGNGGVLLVDGVRDPGWDDWAAGVAGRAAPLPELLGLLEAVAGQPWVRTVRAAEDLFCYLVAHSRAGIPEDWLAGTAAAASAAGATLSVQGRKVYLVPAGLSKAAGLLRLRRLLTAGGAAPRLLCAGDSLLDAPMLLAADAAVRPAHGELHEQGWTGARVAVTAATGAAAGEEIVRWLLDRA
ncbi:hydroxymethylpyrimidine pyrophosphatase-like HAD family hydrolase [Geodermatophilus tzadiensis]|uniref:Hydroxymethylpyrimidine pyrophosphatase-like HAD family hydrolase n=1 Tax=Geodermatophilus tzadiensis TaxID=1137988 RepID=A0A2T0TVF5_9ACTN|nr:HAD family hydrolase [Geodermatophilus tzadiensis]PRY49647.1 hydroxymethylpyrimidine pyrophosphatase-like HAD family hydrolase [Geodermatophilus tzadiensis]